MKIATGGGEPKAPQAKKNTEMSGNISDLSQQKVNAAEHQESPDYSVYLKTEAAIAEVHGIFVVIPDPNPKDVIHTTKKMPETQGMPPQGEGGVKSFSMTAAEAMKTTGPTRFLGRRFGAGDGIICLDCDGWHPPDDWTHGTGYREKSASGTGEHIIARIPQKLLPSGNNKIKRVIDRHEIELFYGKGNGIAISGREATAGPIELDMESDAGMVVLRLITPKSSTSQPMSRKAEGGGEPTADTTQEEEKKTAQPNALVESAGEISFWARFAVKSVKSVAESWCAGALGIPDTASEAMLSVCTRAAYDLAKAGYPIYHPSYATAIFEVFLASGVYKESYAPGKGHDAHPAKMKATLSKAVHEGRKRYGNGGD